MKFDAIILDLDDTLYKEIDFIKSGFLEVSSYLSMKYQYSQDFIYNELLLDFIKGVRKNNFNIMLEKINANKEELEKLIEIYRYHKPNIYLCHDSREILNYLKERYKLALITDGIIKTQNNKIDALGIRDFFDMIIINEIANGIDKSSKEPFIKLMNVLKISPNNSVFIGDNPLKDFIIPKKLGMLSIRIKRIGGIYSDFPLTDDVDYEILDLNKLKQILLINEGDKNY